MGDNKSTDTTDMFGAVLGIHNAKVEDSEGNVGRGAGWTLEEAKRDAFEHLKAADPNDRNYEGISKPDSSDRDSSTSRGLFDSGSDSSRSSRDSHRSNDESPTAESNASSDRSYSSGGDFGGGIGGVRKNTGGGEGLGCLVQIVLFPLIIWGLFNLEMAFWRNLFGNSNKTPKTSISQPTHRHQVSYSAQQGTSRSLSLEENIRLFSSYLQKNDQLAGNFRDYELIMPPAVTEDAYRRNIGNHNYDVAFVGPNVIYTFHSSDGGITWSPLPPRDQFLLNFLKEREATPAKNMDEVNARVRRASSSNKSF